MVLRTSTLGKQNKSQKTLTSSGGKKRPVQIHHWSNFFGAPAVLHQVMGFFTAFHFFVLEEIHFIWDFIISQTALQPRSPTLPTRLFASRNILEPLSWPALPSCSITMLFPCSPTCLNPLGPLVLRCQSHSLLIPLALRNVINPHTHSFVPLLRDLRSL